MPTVTDFALIDTSRWRLPKASVVKRKAPASTARPARNTLRSSATSITKRAFSPSFTALPSPIFMRTRALAPVRSWSLGCRRVPGTSGALTPPRSSHAGYWTASTVPISACAPAAANSARIAASALIVVVMAPSTRGWGLMDATYNFHHGIAIPPELDRATRSGGLGPHEGLRRPRRFRQAQVLLRLDA